MKTTFIYVLLALCLTATPLFGAEAVTAPLADAITATQPVTFMQWIMQKDVILMLLGIALGVSEFLGSSPWLKGNGILDTIVKFLRWLKESREGN